MQYYIIEHAFIEATSQDFTSAINTMKTSEFINQITTKTRQQVKQTSTRVVFALYYVHHARLHGQKQMK